MDDKKKAFGIVLNELKKCNLFRGVYDAKNGNLDFMCGVSAVMEFIADGAGDEAFGDEFFENMRKSEERTEEKAAQSRKTETRTPKEEIKEKEKDRLLEYTSQSGCVIEHMARTAEEKDYIDAFLENADEIGEKVFSEVFSDYKKTIERSRRKKRK